MRKSTIIGGALLTASLIGGAAVAQVYVGPADWSDPYYRSGPPVARPAMYCQKMCPRDFSPCDPIYFKTADGRCSGIPSR
jgi:hypothetical protein